MKVKVRRIDKSLPLPAYQTEGAAAFDCLAREAVTIKPGGIGYAPLNIAMRVPEGYFAMLVARSSLHKKGLMPANGFGVIDADYCGNNDELKAVLYNFTENEVSIDRGERIMQVLVRPYDRVILEEVDDLLGPDRGGFGTTGRK